MPQTCHIPACSFCTLFDRLGPYEPAATIAGLAVSPATAAFRKLNTAIAHLRQVLGDPAYESLARAGEKMTGAAVATYAHDQIDQARTSLTHPKLHSRPT